MHAISVANNLVINYLVDKLIHDQSHMSWDNQLSSEHVLTCPTCHENVTFTLPGVYNRRDQNNVAIIVESWAMNKSEHD